MDIPYFFEEQMNENDRHFTLSETTARHCLHALRMRKGERMHITNGKGFVFNATLMESQKKSAVVSIDGTTYFDEAEKQNAIAVSPVKNPARFEWFLEKAVELGISTIIPVICNRTEKYFYKQERLKNIVVSAMLQSKQHRLCNLTEPMPFSELINSVCADQKFIAYCGDNLTPLSSFNNFQRALILIGPEGDFTPDEIDQALKANFVAVALGSTRLRTETAALTSSVLFQQL